MMRFQVMRTFLLSAVALSAFGAFADAPRSDGAWPLVTMRQMGATTWNAEDVRKLISITGRHPGSCDEFWFAEGLYRSGETGEKRAGQIGSYAPLCEKARIDCGFQQGVTLGHGGIGENPGVAKMSDDAYQVGPDGKRSSIFCPTSPEVLAYEEAGAELYVRLGRLKSMWLDDDLRFGFYKTPVACFCPRCLALLNKKAGTNFSREEWVQRLSSGEKDDPLRAVWADFKAESLAIFAAAAARGARKANPEIRMGYQAISSAYIACGEDYRRILEALSDNWRHPVGIRPGHGYYMETNPRSDLPVKLLDVAREAERCRAYPGWKGSIAYEQENYPHYAMEKTPAACVLEAALALAVGCDAVTLYWYDSKYPEPLEHYEDFMRLTAAWRPYYARLSELAQRTHLGGVAHAPVSNLMTSVANTIPALEKDRSVRRAANDWRLALMGVPVTVAEAGAKSFYADRDVPGGKHYSHADWTKLLDKLDTLPGGKVCVRLDKQAPVLVYPRVTDKDRTAAVTFCNTSIGTAQSLRVRIRRPLGEQVTLARPAKPDLALTAVEGDGDELLVTLPDLPAWSVSTLFVSPVI